MDLHYVTVGSGRVPLLALHGGLGWDHTTLRPWLDPLGDLAQIVYYDHRGNGQSSRSPADAATNIDTWVNDVDAIRHDLGLGQIVLFGHSFGGCIAQEYALRNPDRVTGLVLCSTMPVFDYAAAVLENVRARGTEAQASLFEAAFAAPPATDDAMRTAFEDVLPLYFHTPEGGRQSEAVEAIVRTTRFSAASYAASVASLGTFNTLDRLGALSCPTLILAGRDDFISPTDCGPQRLHDKIPHSEMILFEQSGHFPFIEEPDAFIAALGAWLQPLVSADSASTS